MTSWRFIPPYDATGVEQMAIDSWLLDQCKKGLQPPSLRFYTWAKPTISLGYHQKQFPAHWHDLHYQGQRVDLVRRPTGGRAVLHQGDLTYALMTSGLSGSRRDIYQQLCQFLIAGWRELGVSLTFGAAGRGYIKNPNCFGTATAADLVLDSGYKLIGSAQVYRDGCVLQHGSMRLQPDSELFEKVFGETLSLPPLPETRQPVIIEALTKAAIESFQLSLRPQPLRATEVAAAMTARLPGLALPLESA